MTQRIRQSASVSCAHHGQRIDQVASELFSDYSRARLQAWMRSGELTCDGRPCRPRDKANSGSVLVLDAMLPPGENWQAQPLAMDVVYEDETLLVINKPVGLVVHPGAGAREGTLLNALLHYDPALAQLPRAGIVHRLDKDTSGLLVVARTLPAHIDLVRQLQARTVKREYDAVVWGELTGGGKVEAPVGRHPRDRVRMAVVAGGKPAVTHYRVIRRYTGCTHISCRLETGRTHQIRVHMSHIGHPLVGDSVYGARPRLPAGASDSLKAALQGFARQALHAARLGLVHPQTGLDCQWQAGLPGDMLELLATLQAESGREDG